MERRASSLPIGAVAAAAGVNVETIRFYQRKGLLSAPIRRYGQIRRYEESDVARVQFVKSTMAEQKLKDVHAKLHDLRRMESALRRLVADCCATRGRIACPLIAALRSL